MSDLIAIASDHAALDLKATLRAYLQSDGYAIEDLGTHDRESCDYPDIADALCAWVMQEPGRRGILLCGSGIGVSIAANRHNEIRAALCHNNETATLSRQHNDANVLCLGARMIDEQTAKDCAKAFLTTGFEGGRHERRVEKLSHCLLPSYE